MIPIHVIITALLATPAKGSMECYLSGPTELQQCFGALGEPLIFHLPINAIAGYRISVKKNNTSQILNKANEVVTVHDNHFALFTNGTLKLNNTRRTDAGDYQLEIHGSDGKLLHDIKKHLEIQAPVSKPAVSQMCLSPDRMNISCSSEGDGVEFIFNFDSIFRMQTRDRSQNSTAVTLLLAGSSDNQHKPNISHVTIGFNGQLIGNLMCTVRNSVSREETAIHLTSCKGSSSHLSIVTVAVTAIVATLLLHLALFVGIKHLNKKKRLVTVNEENAEDEIVYSDVRVKKNTRKTRPNTHQNAA